MKRLTIPEKINAIDINMSATLDAIFNSCTREGIVGLLAIKDDWLTEFACYSSEMKLSKRLDPSKHKSFAKYKELLIWLYEHPLEKRKTQYIKKIRDTYIEEGIICPYCGIGSSTTLDHYYCKTSLPQFAILKDNLIPCCGECNKSKGTLKPRKKWKRMFNPYFDTFSIKENEPLIIVHFKKTGESVIFHITPNPLLSKTERMHINFHLSKLKIKTKHKEKIIMNFYRESAFLKLQMQLLKDGDLSRKGYDKFITDRLMLNKAIGYDWSNIVFYSLYKFSDNHWCLT